MVEIFYCYFRMPLWALNRSFNRDDSSDYRTDWSAVQFYICS